MNESPYKTSQEARAAGARTFFNGKPCKYGHLANRRQDSNACVECLKARYASRSRALKPGNTQFWDPRTQPIQMSRRITAEEIRGLNSLVPIFAEALLYALESGAPLDLLQANFKQAVGLARQGLGPTDVVSAFERAER